MSGDSRKIKIPLPRNIGAGEPGYTGSYFFKFPSSAENFLADLSKSPKVDDKPQLVIPAPKH